MYIFDDWIISINYKIGKCLFVGCFKSITVICNILRLSLSVDKMVQGVWLIMLMPLQYKICYSCERSLSNVANLNSTESN